MYSKSTLIMIIGFLAADGKRHHDSDSDLVYENVCLGMKFRSGPPSPYEIALKILRTIKNIAAPNEEVTTSPTEHEKQIPPLRKITSSEESSIQHDADISKYGTKCIGYEIMFPIPANLYNTIKQSDVVQHLLRTEAKKFENSEDMTYDVKQRVPDEASAQIVIEWKDKENAMSGPAPSDFSFSPESHATINGYDVDIDEVTKYIESLLKNPRRMYKSNLYNEIENGAFKSELVDYPPDFLKKRLLLLIAKKEARDKKSKQH